MSDRIHTVALMAATLMASREHTETACDGHGEPSNYEECAGTAWRLYRAVEDADTKYREQHPTSRPLCTCGKEEGSYHPSRPCERHPTDDGA